jgi:predicted 3-demethylubiquinone-9 3-methyltransferase (glyoxalase superfamily)
MDKVTPFLWYDGTAEEAAKLYVSVFKDSKITHVRRWGPGGPSPEGSVLGVEFEIEGRAFFAFNGGQGETFNNSISLFVSCKDQTEVDQIWSKLTSDGGAPIQCGWLKDKFGVAWQIIPDRLMELLYSTDREASKRAIAAMMQMVKIDVAELERAASGAS